MAFDDSGQWSGTGRRKPIPRACEPLLGRNPRFCALSAGHRQFKDDYQEALTRYNAAVEAANKTASANPAPFTQIRDDLVENIRKTLKGILSESAYSKLEAHIRAEKRYMTANKEVM